MYLEERVKRAHLDALDGHESVHSPRYTSPAPPSRDRFVQQPTTRGRVSFYKPFFESKPHFSLLFFSIHYFLDEW